MLRNNQQGYTFDQWACPTTAGNEAENDVEKQLKTQMLCEIKLQFPSLEKKKLYAIATLFVYSRIYFNERVLWGLSVSYPDSTMTK